MNFLRSIFLYILFFVGAAAAMQEGFDVLNRVKSMGPKAGRSSEFAKLVGESELSDLLLVIIC